MKKAPVRVPRLLYLWGPVVLYAALIFALSSVRLTHPLFEQVEKNHADKLVHIVEYTLFGFLLARAFWRHSPIWGSPARLFAAVVIAGSLYAASDEWHQRYVPERDANTGDLAADVAGAALGAMIWIKKGRHTNA